MTTAERRKVMGHLSRSFAWADLTKPDVLAAVDDIDAFLDANATTINAAFPQPFRSTATAEQKAVVVGMVALRRAGLLTTEED